jgi:hypothetical protein
MEQQSLQLDTVETYHYFAVHNRNWRCHVTELFKLCQRAFVGSDIAVGIFDLVLLKKLFHLCAEHSSRLTVEDHFFAHDSFRGLPVNVSFESSRAFSIPCSPQY